MKLRRMVMWGVESSNFYPRQNSWYMLVYTWIFIPFKNGSGLNQSHLWIEMWDRTINLAVFFRTIIRRPSVLQSHLWPIPERSLLVCSGEHVEQVWIPLAFHLQKDFFLTWFRPASTKKRKYFRCPEILQFPMVRLADFCAAPASVPGTARPAATGGRHQGIQVIRLLDGRSSRKQFTLIIWYITRKRCGITTYQKLFNFCLVGHITEKRSATTTLSRWRLCLRRNSGTMQPRIAAMIRHGQVVPPPLKPTK